jgi:hypothetical protein
MRDDSFMQGGHGEFIAIRLWEEELMIRMRLSENEYVKIPKAERARKVVAMKLQGWFSMLEHQLDKQEWEEKEAGRGR